MQPTRAQERLGQRIFAYLRAHRGERSTTTAPAGVTFKSLHVMEGKIAVCDDGIYDYRPSTYSNEETVYHVSPRNAEVEALIAQL